jgi:AcrR family transcriptional regulator
MPSPRAPSQTVASNRRSEIGREQISDIQRARILAAMTAVAAEHGVGRASISRVVSRSGVSRRTFYELFEDREDCFLAAFEVAIQRIGDEVIVAFRRPGKWRERIRASLGALLDALEDDPAMGRLAIVEPLGAGPRALERRRRVLAEIARAVDEGRGEGKGGDGPPPLTAEGVVGGVFALIHSHLLDEAGRSTRELLNPLMSMIVLPYLGSGAARRELRQPLPPAPNGERRVAVDPLRDLEMRLTYRTMRVLLAVGDRAGASNRVIADESGIRDQGQVSKLLARLEQLGLIENASDRRTRGEPNAWTLTERGADVRGAMSV